MDPATSVLRQTEPKATARRPTPPTPLPSFVRRTDGHILDLKHKPRPNPLFDFKERGIRHDLSRATGSLQGRAKKRKQIKSISGMRQKWASEKEQVRNLDKVNGSYLEVIVTDSVYIDISSVDDKIISALYTNAVNQGFENIEMDG